MHLEFLNSEKTSKEHPYDHTLQFTSQLSRDFRDILSDKSFKKTFTEIHNTARAALLGGTKMFECALVLALRGCS